MENFMVNSSMMDEAWYDPERNILQIQFSSMAKYEYYDVPLDVWEAFKVAPSQGQFFHREIRNAYRYEQIMLPNHVS